MDYDIFHLLNGLLSGLLLYNTTSPDSTDVALVTIVLNNILNDQTFHSCLTYPEIPGLATMDL